MKQREIPGRTRAPGFQFAGVLALCAVMPAVHMLGCARQAYLPSTTATEGTPDKAKKCELELTVEKQELVRDKNNIPIGVRQVDITQTGTVGVGQVVRIIVRVTSPAIITISLPQGKNWASSPTQSPPPPGSEYSPGDSFCTNYKEHSFWAVALDGDVDVTVKVHADGEVCEKGTGSADDQVMIRFRKQP